MRDVLEQYLPKGTRYSKADQIYTLPPPWGSRIQIIQQEAGRGKFQGARILAAWVDEEFKASEGGEEIFSEILARKKPGQPLYVHYTLTPLNGLDWTYNRLLDERSPNRYKNVEVFGATIWDASISHGGWYTDEEIEEIAKKYPEHERAARLEGKASVLSGSLYFSRQALEEAQKKCEPGKRKRIEKKRVTIDVTDDEGGHLIQYRPPTKDRQYIMGVDPAGGVGRDRSVAIVFDRTDLAVCAIYCHDYLDPDFFANEIVLPLGMVYNNALVVVESNNHGGTVISNLKGRSNLWLRQQWDKTDSRYVAEYGWRTDTKTKLRILDALARALREDEWTPCEQLIREMMTLVMHKDDKVEALVGYFDDAVMAAGIALAVAYMTPEYERYTPKDFKIEVSGPSDLAWMAT